MANRVYIAMLLLVAGCGTDEGAQCDRCRGDEVCVQDACVNWQDSPLSVDFALVYDEANPRRIVCTVAEGGFPRAFVDSLRFDFGDGFSGYGEDIGHVYARPGVYRVALEVRLQGYRIVGASKTAVIPEADGSDPAPRVSFTIDDLPAYLNGTEPYASDNGTPNDPDDDFTAAFNLLLPQTGFAVDLALLDTPGAAIDPSSIRLTADVALGDGGVPAQTDVSEQLVFDPVSDGVVRRARWVVDAAHAFPEGRATLTLTAADSGGGMHMHPIAFDVVELTPARDPFDRPMVWLFRFDQDHFTNTPGTDGRIIDSVAGADGEADFLQELRLIGAQGADAEANAIYLGWIVDAIVAEAYRYYQIGPDGVPHGGIELAIYRNGATGAPDPADFAVDGEFSMMRFGGAFNGFLGFSGFSWHNEVRVDDSTAGRGIATGSILDATVNTATLAAEFWGIMPGLGTPVGEHEHDAAALADTFDRYDLDNDPAIVSRYDELSRVARLIAVGIGAVTAHEMGHAMGLMPDEPPPVGFFGGRGDVSFINADFTNSHHADFPAVNLMQAGGNPLASLTEALETIEFPSDYDLVQVAVMAALENRLSPYSLAYFRRQLTYADVPVGP